MPLAAHPPANSASKTARPQRDGQARRWVVGVAWVTGAVRAASCHYDGVMTSKPAAQLSEGEARFDAVRRRVGAILGPLSFAALLAIPMPGLSDDAHMMAAVAVATIVLWVTEALPLAITAMLAPCVAVLLGVSDAKAALAGFAHPLIFLFLGGFMLAEALSVQGLDRRATLWLLARPWIAGRPARAMAAVAAIAWAFSMWISNTATTAMLVPIAVGLCQTLRKLSPQAEERLQRGYAEGLLMTLAYAASIGGIATPIGTAPNMIAIEQLGSKADTHFDFLRWMSFGLPASALMFAALLALALWRFPPPDRRVEGLTDHVRRELEQLGPMRRGERRVLMIFAVAVTAWIAPALLRLALGEYSAWTVWARGSMDEGVVAIAAASLLFAVPAGDDAPSGPGPLLSWSRATTIDWGTLFLLGGGFALSTLVFDSGLAEAVATGILGGRSLSDGGALLLALSVLLVIYLTEVASNTATTNMMLPVIIPIAAVGGANPVPVTLSIAMAASLAFMLPVSTPPNAIAYGTGRIRIGSMIRFGAILDLAGLALIITLGLTLLPWLYP